MDKPYVQCGLSKGEDRLTAMVEYRRDLKVGVHVELIGQEGLWRVDTVSQPIAYDSIKRNWNNNI